MAGELHLRRRRGRRRTRRGGRRDAISRAPGAASRCSTSAGRIKPCGGAIPPRLMRDFAIPLSLLKARVSKATMISPKGERVDMPIDGGYVGMVDRAEFDEFLRVRAAEAGAERIDGTYERLDARGRRNRGRALSPERRSLRARNCARAIVVGADGALTEVGRQEIAGADRTPFVFAYHEIVEAPAERAGPLRDLLSRRRCRRISTPGCFRMATR